MAIRFEKQKAANTSKYLEIMNLPDSDYDGYSDFSDFSYAFANKSMSRFELSEVYRAADLNNDGMISFSEWTPFYKLFILPFLSCQVNDDFLIPKQGVEGCVKKFEFKYLVFKDYLEERAEKDDLKNRLPVYLRAKDGMKLSDYLMIKKVVMAWSNCTLPPAKSIKKAQMICLSKYLTFENPLSPIQLNNIFDTLTYFSEEEDVNYEGGLPSLSFLGVLNLFSKRRIYFRLISTRKRAAVNKTELVWNILENNISLDELMIWDIFKHYKQWGLDFRSFYLLMKFEDMIALKGNPEGLDYQSFNESLSKKSFMALVRKEIDRTNLEWTPEMLEEAEDEVKKAAKKNKGKPAQMIDSAKASIENLERNFLSSDMPPIPPPPLSFLQLSSRVSFKEKQGQAVMQVTPKIPIQLQRYMYWKEKEGKPNEKSREALFNVFGNVKYLSKTRMEPNI